MNETIKVTDSETFTKVAALGAVAGLRAMMAPALLSYAAATRHDKTGLGHGFLASPIISVASALLSAGELVADKLPTTPNRTETVGLAARIVSGATVGGLICAADKKSVATGAALGALAAVAAAYAGQETRRAISRETGIPSPLLGGVEDAIAFGIGATALNIFGKESA